MGTWGYGPFENDDAMDWLASLASADCDLIDAALASVIDRPSSQSIDAPDAAIGIAAATIVAAGLGRVPGSDVARVQEVTARCRGASNPKLRHRALRAVHRITSGSELRDLWHESRARDGWYAVADDLIERLSH